MYKVISNQPSNDDIEEVREPRKRHFFKWIFWIILLLIIVSVAYVGAHFALAYRTIVVEPQGATTGNKSFICYFKKCTTANPEPIENDPNPIPAEEPNRFDVLILGIRGEDDLKDGGLLTDTVMLLSIDKTTGKSSLVSIPRDFYVDMTGQLSDGKGIHVMGKLNEVYVHGYEHNEGLTFTSQMISRITGVHVDRSVLFDFNAFGGVVEALGGIDVYLDKPFSEKSQWGYEFSLPAGNNHLDGQQALYYVRSRYSSSDFDRARRQQQVIFAIKKKATELGFMANPVKISNLLSSLKGNVKTNVQLWEMKDMIELSKNVTSSNLKTYVLSTDNYLYETHDAKGSYILKPKGDNLKVLRDFFDKGLFL